MRAKSWRPGDRAGGIHCRRGVQAFPERLGVSACVLVVMLGLLASSVQAASPDLEAQVRDIAQQLRCPVCQGLSVGDSPSELAHEMRAVVREQLQQGKTREEVLDYFVQRYGEWILLAPPKHGFNLVIWVLPFVLLPAGAMAVYAGTRRWVRNRQASTLPSTAVDPRDTERLQRELDSYT
jgi:cytochrome c-type biogenesis protein CcmH